LAGLTRIALVVCLWVAAMWADEPQSDMADLPSSLAFVEALAQSGDHESAALECRRLLFFSPAKGDEPALHFTLARELYLAQRYGDAITEFRAYYKQYPGDKNAAQAIYLWGNSELMTGNANAADQVWRWVQREHPASDWAARAGIKLGLAEAGRNNWMEAANSFNWLYEHSGTHQSMGRELSLLAAKGKKMPRRDVTTGVILSAVLPGTNPTRPAPLSSCDGGSTITGRWAMSTSAKSGTRTRQSSFVAIFRDGTFANPAQRVVTS